MNSFHPFVSIVIPVYNGSNYLQCAIDSALGQDYDNIEVIVVNDGSSDNTEEIAKSYGNKIRFFSKENGGVSTALNLAIQNAHGEYISWLSHDDYYLPNKVSRQIEELGKINGREKILIFADARINRVLNGKDIDTEETTHRLSHSGYYSEAESLKALFLSTIIHGCSLLIPKIAFEKAGYFNINLLTTQDYDLWFKFIKAGYQFYHLPEILLVTRHHELQDTIKKREIAVYEQLSLFRSANRMFRKQIKSSDKEFQFLVNKRIAARTWRNTIRKIAIKIIPEPVYQCLKELYHRKSS